MYILFIYHYSYTFLAQEVEEVNQVEGIPDIAADQGEEQNLPVIAADPTLRERQAVIRKFRKFCEPSSSTSAFKQPKRGFGGNDYWTPFQQKIHAQH